MGNSMGNSCRKCGALIDLIHPEVLHAMKGDPHSAGWSGSVGPYSTVCEACRKKEADDRRYEEKKKEDERRHEEKRKQERTEERKEERKRQLHCFIEGQRKEEFRKIAENTRAILSTKKNNDSAGSATYTGYHGEYADDEPLGRPAQAIPDDVPMTREGVLLLLNQIATDDPAEWKINGISPYQVEELLEVFLDLLTPVNDAAFILPTKSLEWLQVYLLQLYCLHYIDDDSEVVRQSLEDVLDVITQSATSKTELAGLTKAMCMLVVDHEFAVHSTLFKDMHGAWGGDFEVNLESCAVHKVEFLERLLGQEGAADRVPSCSRSQDWAKVACEMLIKLCILPSRRSTSSKLISRFRSLFNKQYQSDFSDSLCKVVASETWMPANMVEFLHCLASTYSPNDKKLLQTVDFILANRVPAQVTLKDEATLMDMLQTGDAQSVFRALKTAVAKEKGKSLDELALECNVSVRAKTVVRQALYQLRKSGHPDDICREKEKATPAVWVSSVKLKDPTDNTQMASSLVSLCCAVKKVKGWWPRVSQMMSWAMLILKEDSKGRLAEISTGEGKSCIIAMVSAMLALQGKSVDIVTSSPVLAERDADDWAGFYELFNLSVNHNADQTNDKSRAKCYTANIVYGTVGCFAADVLRQEFQLKQVRAGRGFDAVIVDEVDFMLLDKGVQITYLSHNSVGLRHLEPVLAMVWNAVSRHNPVLSDQGDVFFTDTPKPFYLAVAEVLDASSSEIQNPLQLLQIAENERLIRNGFTKEVESVLHKSPTGSESGTVKSPETTEGGAETDLVSLLKEFDTDRMVKALSAFRQYVPYIFQPYTVGEDGKIQSGSSEEEGAIPFLVADEGMCSILHNDETMLKGLAWEKVKSHIRTESAAGESKDEFKLDIPASLCKFVEDRLEVWVENAFLALKMREGRDYIIKDKEALPVDHHSTGVVEVNKRWGDGLQQFVEMKHKLKISPMSMVTNLMSNIEFFHRYSKRIYGVSGTLGSEADRMFLQRQFNVDFCFIPTHKPSKLYEETGEVLSNEADWMRKICKRVKRVTSKKWWTSKKGQTGRPVLVICEDINTATKVKDCIEAKIKKEVILYTRSDNSELDTILGEVGPGQVIVSTNLAGRGTDIKVTPKANKAGGLFVLVTFLPTNSRIERQAFGRTAREGHPGSAQIILNSSRVPKAIRHIQTMSNLKTGRDFIEQDRVDTVEKTDVAECLLKEQLFRRYCEHRSRINDVLKCGLGMDTDERKLVITCLDDFWAMWLQMNSERMCERDAGLIPILDAAIRNAEQQIMNKNSPNGNIYHVIKFGNELMFAGKYKDACRFYDRAIENGGRWDAVPNRAPCSVDICKLMFPLYSLVPICTIENGGRWAAIAYYNRAYCIIQDGSSGYVDKGKADLNNTMEVLENYKTELVLTKQLMDLSWHETKDDAGFSENIETRLQILYFFEKEVQAAVEKLAEIGKKGADATVKATSVFSLVPEADTSAYHELYELWQLGLVNVFSVSEKPKFCWAALIVFALGVMQVVAGVFAISVSMGTLTSFGTNLIGEGISDMIDGGIGMYTGKFELKSWAIQKSIGIAVSLTGGSIGKLLRKGPKACKASFVKTAKQLKAVPKMLSKEVSKQGLSCSLKQTIKTAGIRVVKEVGKQVGMRVLNHIEDKVIQELHKAVEDKIHEELKQSMVDATKSGELGKNVDRLASYYGREQEPAAALEELKHTFEQLGNQAVEPFMRDRNMHPYVTQFLQGVFDRIRAEVGTTGKLGSFLSVVGKLRICVDVATAVVDVREISGTYVDSLTTISDALCKEYDIPENDAGEKPEEVVREQDMQKVDIGNILAKVLSAACAQILNEKVTSHVTNAIRTKVNGAVGGYLENEVLNICRTDEKLRAAACANYVAHMKTESDGNQRRLIENSQTMMNTYICGMEEGKPGSIVEARILADKYGIEVRILDADTLKPIRTVGSSDSKDSRVELVFQKGSKEAPEGHYDVRVNGKIISGESEGKNCLYHALARGLNPNATDADVAKTASKLRQESVEAVRQNPAKWDRFIEKNQWTLTIRGGNDYMMVGGLKKRPDIKQGHDEDAIRDLHLGQVGNYKQLQDEKRRRKENKGPKTNLDHVPPVASLKTALSVKNPSDLALALGSGLSDPGDHHGSNQIVITVPENHHVLAGTSGASKEAYEVRNRIGKALKDDDDIRMMKMTLVASCPTFIQRKSELLGRTSELPDSIADPNRRELYDGRGYQSIIKDTYDRIGGRDQNREHMKQWVNSGGFKNPNDPIYKEMESIYKRK